MTKDERLIIPDAEMGGDSACWAHLFADAGAPGLGTNLAGSAMAFEGRGPVWTQQTDDLNVNQLVFHAGQGVDEHVNTEVDVLMIGIAGEGVVSIDGTPHALPAGHVVIVPKGARRATRVLGERFAYLTCHRRRAGLLPKLGPRPKPTT
jgi:quercetin dioxygenase-like cupin family protein